MFKELFAPKGETAGLLRAADDRRVLRRRLPRGHLDSVPSGLPELSTLRQHLRRREHARDAWPRSCPALGWLLPIPFYFMELLVGLVQAMVFMLLTAVFTLLICQHEDAGRQRHADDAADRDGVDDDTRKDIQDERQRTRRPRSARRSHCGRIDWHGGAIAVGRNPGASTKIMVQSILAIAFAEAIVFYALFLAQ